MNVIKKATLSIDIFGGILISGNCVSWMQFSCYIYYYNYKLIFIHVKFISNIFERYL